MGMGTKSGNQTSSSGADNGNWKVFRRDTEAGRLLSRLYGVDATSSHAAAAQAIHYPKLKTSAKPEVDLKRRSRWNAPNPSDLSKHKHQKAASVSIVVPRVGTKKKKNHISSTTRRKKTYKECLATIDDNRNHNQNYRPPNYMKNSVSEKEKLCDVFEHGDGNALPKSALPSKEQREEWMSSSTRSTMRSSRKNMDMKIGNQTQTNESSSSIAMQLVQEIRERREFQSAMEQCAAGDATRQQTVEEISIRMKELMKCDADLAKSLLVLEE